MLTILSGTRTDFTSDPLIEGALFSVTKFMDIAQNPDQLHRKVKCVCHCVSSI